MRAAAARIVFCAAVAGWATMALAADPVHLLKVGDRSVSIPWSADWQELSTTPSDAERIRVRFGTADPLKFMVMLSAVPDPGVAQTDQQMEKLASDFVRWLSEQSVEKELPVQRISSDSAHGYYVCATDRAPKPDQFKYICQGVVNSGDAPFIFLVLYNESGKSDAEIAVTALKSLRLSAKN